MQLLAKSGFAFALMRGKVSCHARHIKSSVRRNLMPTQFDLPRQFHLVLSRCLNHLMYNYLGVELLVSGDFRQWGDTPYSHVEWWRQYRLNPFRRAVVCRSASNAHNHCWQRIRGILPVWLAHKVPCHVLRLSLINGRRAVLESLAARDRSGLLRSRIWTHAHFSKFRITRLCSGPAGCGYWSIL